MNVVEQSDVAAGIMALIDHIEALVYSGAFTSNHDGESDGRDYLETLATAAIDLMDPDRRDGAWATLQAYFDEALEQVAEQDEG